MGLRKHQAEMSRAIDGIINKTPKFKDVRKIIMSVVAGGGKGSVPVNAGRLIQAGLADGLCCIVPRQSLQTQCEEVFMDPFFQDLFGVKMQVRASTNEMDPCKGMHGFVTSYQALGVDRNKYVLSAIRRRRYVLILDEFHHVEEDSPWHQAVEELIEAAEFVIMMSGTLSRANKKKIACMNYKGGYVDLDGDKYTHVIKYSRSDALAEDAILPIKFHLHDAEMEWRELKGSRVVQVGSFAEVQKADRAKALYTALQKNFAEQLMDASLHHWLQYRKEKPEAKVLVVTAGIDDAKRSMTYLNELGIPALLATSHKPDECIASIREFKAAAPVLVTIAVAYEGLDVPAVSHVCVLTRIRSNEWMEQCVSRATRVHKKSGSYRSQRAHIFAPKDPAFLEFVDAIKKEQSTRIRIPKGDDDQLDLFPVDIITEEERSAGGGGQSGPCIPLKAQIQELSKKLIGGLRPPDGAFTHRGPVRETPKQEEMSLRRKIDKYIRAYAAVQGYEYADVNRDVKEIFNGRPRGDLTLDELRKLLVILRQRYPFKDEGQYIPPSNCKPVFIPEPAPENSVWQKGFF